MKKKIIVGGLVIASVGIIAAFAMINNPKNYLEYEIIDDHVIITNCKDSRSSVKIPDEIQGCPVTEIGHNAFADCKKLKRIIFSDNITSINKNAFRKCSNLTEISLPDSLINIESNAFYRCSGLTEIKIPDSVKNIDIYAFSRCENLKEFKLEKDNTEYTVLDGALYTSDLKKLVKYPEAAEAITLPETLTEIEEAALAGCKNLKEIIIPGNIKNIGEYAFAGCDNITEITIADSISSIEPYVFSFCKSLNKISIPDSITSIGEKAFCGCSNLTEIIIPASVKEIGENAVGYYYEEVDKDGYVYTDYIYKYENITIKGYKNTAAEKYANDNEFKFIALD